MKTLSGFNIGDIKKSKPLQRLLAYIRKNPWATTMQIMAATDICNVSTRISELRHQGFNIVSSFRNRTETGSKVFVYKLKK